MLNHIEATLFFNQAIEKTKKMMLREGFIFPYIFVLKKSKDIELNFKDDIILDQATSSLDETDPDAVHVGYLTLSGSEAGYVTDAQELMKNIVRTVDPDAIGICVPSLYNEGDADVISKLKSLSCDPESIRVIHAAFYVREDPKATMLIVPYVNHGELPADKQIPDERVYNVTFADFSWTRPLKKIGPCVKNPYQRSTV